MQRNSSRPTPLGLSIAVAAALAAMLPAAHAQQNVDGARQQAEGIELGSWTNLLAPPVDEDNAPSIASAHFIEGSPETELTLTGDAEVRRAGTVITGEKIVYTQATGVVTTEGNASVSRNGAKFTGPAFSYNLDDETGGAENIEYNYGPRGLQGEAGCARFQSADVTEFEDVVITSCKKDNRSWWLEMDTLTLDEYDESGEGTGAVLKLGGVPVFGSPWFTFPLSAKRKSGFLSPTLGFNSERGFDLAVPYYFNLAPNYDYTLAPRILSKRGIVLGNAKAKFDETVELHVRLGIDPRQADQQVRGVLVLPNGTGKTKKVLVIAKGEKADAAAAAGADFVGAEEMIQKIQTENWFGFDVMITTPDMMGVVGRIGRLLGPKGLMPNPKSGTVTMDVTRAVQEVKAGKVEYRLDKTAIIHCPIGKKSFGTEKILENFNALMDAIVRAKPAAAKGQYVKSVTLTSTMGPGVKVSFNRG